MDIADFHLLVVVSFDALKKREDWVRNHHTDRRIGNPARAKRARGSFSQRALRDQKKKMNQINCIFPVPQANQHLAYFSLRESAFQVSYTYARHNFDLKWSRSYTNFFSAARKSSQSYTNFFAKRAFWNILQKAKKNTTGPLPDLLKNAKKRKKNAL